MILSQNISISQSQLNEIYKGLKQNEYLKDLNAKSSEALKASEKIVKEQSAQITKLKDALAKSEEINGTQTEISAQEIALRENEIKRLTDVAKHQGKKKWKSGFMVGSISVAVIGAATTIFIISR